MNVPSAIVPVGTPSTALKPPTPVTVELVTVMVATPVFDVFKVTKVEPPTSCTTMIGVKVPGVA